MRDLNYQLKKLGDRNRDGSYGTQARRAYLLSQMANQLHALGFRRMHASSLRQKHVLALIRLWQSQSLSTGTIKNRMSALRWWAEKVGRHSVIANSNAHYGIERRRYVSTESRAQELDAERLAKITDPYVQLSLRLQRDFGLRREEAIKFIVNYADRGDHLELKASWTKGGKARSIPIVSERQRALLDEIRERVGAGSLIPPDKTFIQQLRIYVRQLINVGLSRMHGLRHRYAQSRYLEIAGFACPLAGGPARSALTHAQRVLDEAARKVISRELGHERPGITTVYCGK